MMMKVIAAIISTQVVEIDFSMYYRVWLLPVLLISCYRMRMTIFLNASSHPYILIRRIPSIDSLISFTLSSLLAIRAAKYFDYNFPNTYCIGNTRISMATLNKPAKRIFNTFKINWKHLILPRGPSLNPRMIQPQVKVKGTKAI